MKSATEDFGLDKEANDRHHVNTNSLLATASDGGPAKSRPS